MSGCQQCGMWVDPKKPYHPYAACLMFMGCKNGNTVQANLDAVVEYGRNKVDAAPADWTIGVNLHAGV
jgi:hypothetical protein